MTSAQAQWQLEPARAAEGRRGGHWQQLRSRRLQTQEAQEGTLQALGGPNGVPSRSRRAHEGPRGQRMEDLL